MVLLLAFWGVAGTKLLSQTDSTTVPQSSLSSASEHALGGVVVNAVTGEPIRRALVVAGATSGASFHTMLTDAEGRFAFEAVRESEVTIAARKPGFFNDLELHPDTFQPQIVRTGTDASSLVLKLVPESVIFGHVATVKGEPVEDAPVRVFREHLVDGRRQWEQRSQAVTDEDGQFRVAGLVPGQYLLAAGPLLPNTPLSTLRPGSRREQGFTTVFYPGVPDTEGAAVLAISGGQQMQADFSLKPEPIFKVSGSVVGLSPGLDATPQFLSKAGEAVPTPTEFDTQTAKFEAQVPGGEYVVQARVSGPSGQLLGADLPLLVNADLSGVALTLAPATRLLVDVELRSAAPLDTSKTSGLRREQVLSQVRLISTENRFQAEEFQADATEKGGALAVHNVMPGRYSVEVAAVSPWCVQSVASGSIDLLREDLVVAYGRGAEALQVTLRDDCAGVRGKIIAAGKPVRGGVLLLPDEVSSAHAQMALPDVSGEFMFRGLAPGGYRLLAFDSLDTLEFRNPEVLGPYLAKAVRVTLQANETANVDVERIDAAKDLQ